MIRLPIKKVSAKQAKKFRGRAKVYDQLDHEWESVCQGCGRSGPVDHSHLLSQKSFPHLADHRSNIVPHCRACHLKYENPTQRWKLNDYLDNMEFIQRVAPREAERMTALSELKIEKHYPEQLEAFLKVTEQL
jgi:hypothetical protein